jgi:hypothetical protein
MLPSTITRPFLAVTSCAALAVAVLAAPGTSAAAGEKERAVQSGAADAGTLTDFGFDAASYGSKTTGNPAAASGATALSHVPCTRYVPRSHANFVAEVGDGDGVALHGVTTRNHTARTDGTTAAVSRVHIADGTLAGGQVEFTDLTGRVRSFHDTAGFHVQTVSQLGALTVGGVPIELPGDRAEMEVPVPGAGTLVINATVRHETAFSSTGAVNVLRFDGSDGTTERVGRAYSRIDGQIEGGLFAGAAWGSDGRVDGTAALGKAALRPMPCPGTRGKVLRNSTGAATTDFGYLGVRRSAVSGVQTEDSASGFARSNVTAAGFGDGQLRFRNITAVANVTRRANGTVVRSARGTGVGRIIVGGVQIPTPAAGEPQQVPGLGWFTVGLVHRSPNGIDVTAVEVRLHNGTPANTTDDTVVNLGRAQLAIRLG